MSGLFAWKDRYWPDGLVCCRCKADVSTHGYCIDSRLYCPECSWDPSPPDEQLALASFGLEDQPQEGGA